MERDVPFTDVYVDDEIVEAAGDVLRSTRYVKGPELDAFENEFADLCGTEYAVGVSNGTAALLLAMKSIGLGPSDDVFVPAHTFFASVSPVLEIGANPVFVDVNPDRYTIDTDDLLKKVEASDTPSAIVPVHLYGQPADMSGVHSVASDYDVTIIEDAAQAHAAEYEGEQTGSLGDIGCFSFYPSKNMTVGGDGGMLTTDNPDIAARARQYRNHGRGDDGIHQTLGLNYRLNEVNAAIGRVQARHVKEWGQQRNEAAMHYNERLSDVPEVTIPREAPEVHHVYHLYVICAPDRDDLQQHLESQGISTGVHYETPAHQHPAVAEHVGEVSGVDTAEKLCGEILSLPMHPRIENEEIEYVCSAIEGYYT